MAKDMSPWDYVAGTPQGAFDVSEPPKGIPRLFWEKLLQDPANQKGLKWLTDPTAKGGYDRFPNKAQYLAFLQQGAEDQFRRLPKAQQQEYIDADASGAAYDPNSVEGRLEQQGDLVDDFAGADFEGADPQALIDATTAAAAGDTAALEKLNELLAGIKDPKLAEYVGDYISQAASAAPDQRDVEAQQRQLAKLEGLSDPSITAEEKLMMEMARRQTGSDLKAKRGAIANDLQSRGVYGSGSELTMNLAAQQEAAQRQALEMLGAQSNAQQRAMTALRGAADLSTSMRGSSAQESQFRGTAADRAAEFNKSLLDSYNRWKDEKEKENNDRAIGRGEKIAANVGKVGQVGVGAASSIFDIGNKAADKKYLIKKDALDAKLKIGDRWIDRGAQGETEEKLDL